MIAAITQVTFRAREIKHFSNKGNNEPVPNKELQECLRHKTHKHNFSHNDKNPSKLSAERT